ncbi:MAG: hypothetical protein IKB87_03670 [Clostridia bacterium]|nr:hypothetical protein [Clostridia bacterium]
MTVFSMLGTLMFCSKIIMEVLPNIHLVGMFTMVYTLAFRKKALLPIYIFVLLNGLYAGFSVWWIPYLYIWTVLWGLTMLLPKNMPPMASCVVYPILCALHGLLFGILYAPTQALVYGLSFPEMLGWIAAGFPFDVLHGIGNFIAGFLILPLSNILKKLMKQ